MSWIEDQKRWDENGIAPKFWSKNSNVPKSYRLDLDFVCFTNAENLANVNLKLRYVEGEARIKGDKSRRAWGHHAWCVTSNGTIVDPYFEWKFPNKIIEYHQLCQAAIERKYN